MSDQFVVKKKPVATVINGSGPQYADMSVVADDMGGIRLVIGARYDDRRACAFNKDGIKELIGILTEIHEALEE